MKTPKELQNMMVPAEAIVNRDVVPAQTPAPATAVCPACGRPLGRLEHGERQGGPFPEEPEPGTDRPRETDE